jgi:hypothetical protein
VVNRLERSRRSASDAELFAPAKSYKVKYTTSDAGKRAMIIEITNIVAGLILAMGVLPSIPAVGKSLEKVAKWLGRFQTVIGIIAIILGILYFGLQGIVAIVAGFVLAAGIMTSIPAIGKDLAKVAKWLGGFQTIIGIIAIILGIWGLLF